MTLQTWLVFAAVSVVPALSPGPAVLLALSNSLRFTPRAAVWSSLGNSVGLLVLSMAVVFGLRGLMAASAAAFTAIKLIGAAYLCYLGVRLWLGGGSARIEGARVAVAAGRGRLFVQGLLVAVTNPKAVVILVALLPPFIDTHANLLVQALVLSLTYSALCYANHMFVALCAGRFGRLLRSDRGERLFRRVVGGTFIGLGAAMASSSPP